jgi:hypothetical protein
MGSLPLGGLDTRRSNSGFTLVELNSDQPKWLYSCYPRQLGELWIPQRVGAYELPFLYTSGLSANRKQSQRWRLVTLERTKNEVFAKFDSLVVLST